MEKNIYTFGDGLKLVHCRQNGVYSVSLGVFTGAGCNNETAKDNGISHCIEHMLFKGTTNRSAFQISEDIDKIGAQMNAYTTKQATCYYTIGLDEHLETCADVLSDMMFNSTFDDGELDKERKVIDEEISMSEDDGADMCLDNLSEAYFGSHPLGQTILGPRKNVASFKGDDLRRYMNANYAADSTVVAIAGNVDFERAKDIAGRYFASRMPVLDRKWKDTPAVSASRYSCTVKKDLAQSHLAMAFPSLPYRHDLDMALTVFNAILGGNMSSRLFQEVREKSGLAYTVYSSPSTYINNGYLCIYAGVNVSNAVKACRITARVLRDLKTNPFTADELDKGKQQVKTAYVLSRESTASMMRQFGRYALYTGELLDPDKDLARLDAVSLDDMAAIADAVLDFDKAAVSYVGKKPEANLRDVFCNM